MGFAGINEQRQGSFGLGWPRHRFSASHTAAQRSLERSRLQCTRLSTGLLFKVSRLRQIFSPAGIGVLPKLDGQGNMTLGIVVSLPRELRSLTDQPIPM